MTVRFLQIGDTHLGAVLSGLPVEIAGGLRDAVRDAVRAAFQRAHELPVDIVLMPGDLFEQDGVDPAGQLRFIYEQAASIAPIPVVIAPGNHDAISGQSPYVTERAPANVFVFTSGQLGILDTKIGAVVGRGVQAGESTGAVDWSKLPASVPAPGLMVLHASVLHAEDGRRHEQMIAPMSQQALENCGYVYTALGHFHNYREFRRQSALGNLQPHSLFAAYAGCPQGQGWDEPGIKGYLVGQFGPDDVCAELWPCATHTIQRKRYTLPPEYAADALERLERELSELALDLNRTDMLELTLTGRWPQLWRPELEQYMAKATLAAWHAKPVELSRVQFTPPLVGVGESGVLDEFLSRCDAAIGDGGEDEEAWRLARYLGHRLLSAQGLPGEVA